MVDTPNNEGNKIAGQFVDQLKKQLAGMPSEMGGADLGIDIAEVMNSGNVLNMGAKLVGKIDKKMVLQIGHQIGYKFRPWEATKLVGKFTKAVPFINIAAAALDAYSYISKQKKEKERNSLIREFKQDINSTLDKTVTETKNMVQAHLIHPYEALVTGAINMLKGKKLELIGLSEKNKKFALSIESKKEECLQIYDEIYKKQMN